MFHKIKCYILSYIDNKKVKIEINDQDSLIKMNNLINKLKITKHYKLPIDKQCNNRFYININDKTKFSFKNIYYNDLSDLYGIEVFITFKEIYYQFSKEKQLDNIPSQIDEQKKEENTNNNDIEIITIQGFYFIATKITNLKIFD